MVGIGVAGGCGSGAGYDPFQRAAFQRQALAAIYQVTNSGTGFGGRALLHLRTSMRDKGRAAAAGAVTLSSLHSPSSLRALRRRVLALLWKLDRDFARASRLTVDAALRTDALDMQRLGALRSVVMAMPVY
jgi:hypothetical protein